MLIINVLRISEHRCNRSITHCYIQCTIIYYTNQSKAYKGHISVQDIQSNCLCIAETIRDTTSAK